MSRSHTTTCRDCGLTMVLSLSGTVEYDLKSWSERCQNSALDSPAVCLWQLSQNSPQETRQAMSDGRPQQQILALFLAHIDAQPKIDDIAAVQAKLPRDPQLLRALGLHCLAESRKALRAGHHIEGRRLDVLARQLQHIADVDRN